MTNTAHTPETLARQFAQNMCRSAPFSTLEALHHALGVLDVASLKEAIAEVYEPLKAAWIKAQQCSAEPEPQAFSRQAVILAQLANDRAAAKREIEAATNEMARRFHENRPAGTLNPSMQARHTALDERAL